MRERRLDALMVTSPPNFRYFTGFDSQFWESPTRPWFCIVPAEGPCVLVVPEIGVPALARGWIEEIRSWPAPRPADDGVSLVVEALGSLGRRFGRIGLELGRESVLRMPVIDFFAIRDRLPGWELVDGSPCLWATRAIKSPGEVDRIRASCGIVSDAFDALPALVEGGGTERDACRTLATEIVRRGAYALPFMAAASGPGGYPEIISSPSSRPLQRGDVLIIDVGATIEGWFCDFDRNFTVGPSGEPVRRAHEALWLATEAGIQAAVPGATTDDLWTAMARVLGEKYGPALENNVGRMGHGLGLQLTEPPSIMPGDGTVLRAGMVITIEPGFEYERGKMIVHEENILITEGEPELLTRRAPREMPVIHG
jgi:Xaa-Pro aminopeptidase